MDFRAFVGLGPRGLFVAHGARHPVRDGQPKCQNRMEQQSPKQPHFKHLDDDVGAHEVAKSIVPFAAVMPQNEQVGAGVEQQEETQEGT